MCFQLYSRFLHLIRCFSNIVSSLLQFHLFRSLIKLIIFLSKRRTQSFLRNVVGAMFPLFTDQIYAKLGIQGAGSMVGGIALALACIPFVLFIYGSRLRARSTFMNGAQ